MRKIAKYLAAAFTVALLGALLAGCAQQGASSAAPEPQTTEELIAELEQVSANNDYQSVTMDMEGTVKVDYAAMFGTDDDDESASAESASAESASASAESADSNASADAEESENSAMEIPMNVNAKCDLSSGEVNMYLTMNMFGQNIELYIKGEDAVMVMNGQAVSASLEELGMSEYASIDKIMESQGADFSKFKDAVQSIEKSTEGDETLYKVVCDPAKFADEADEESAAALAQLGSAALSTVEMTYRVNADGLMTGLDMSIAGKGYSSDITAKLYDYNATEVPEAPEATMKYSEMMDAMGGSEANDDAADASDDAEASGEAAE